MTGRRDPLAELRAELDLVRAERDANYQIAMAARAGCAAAGEQFAVRAEQAEDAAAAARRAQRAALAEAADRTRHVGRLYSRLLRADRLVTEYADQLPPEFVTAIRQQTQPDVASLVEAAR